MPMNILRTVFICGQISVFSYIIVPIHLSLVCMLWKPSEMTVNITEHQSTSRTNKVRLTYLFQNIKTKNYLYLDNTVDGNTNTHQ